MEQNIIINHGKNTLICAMQGLQAVIDGLDEKFIAAVDIITSAKGRLIVTGMGKSGHIARKIAATFASTGTPAYFVHPAEASHGDMGMISAGDVVMMLSNSGETAELGEMIAYAKRFNIALIAIVRREKSMLVEVADVAIVLPAIPEASPIGAPTTSTMMMLGYGDALAMAVLAQKGFTQEDFGVLHRGGKLGKDLLRVRDLMRPLAELPRELPLVQADDAMKNVLMIMTRCALGCAIVVGANKQLQGIITDGDLRRHINDDLMAKNAKDIMTSNPMTIAPNILAVEALGILNERSITCLAVTEGLHLVGLLHIHDCLRAGIA